MPVRRKTFLETATTILRFLVYFTVACVVVYHVIDLLHYTEYRCDGINYYRELPNRAAKCVPVWTGWVFKIGDPLAFLKRPFDFWDWLVAFWIVLFSGLAAIAIQKYLWRMRQLEWLLEAVISGAENIVQRTQFNLVLELISESQKTFDSLGADLLKELAKAKPSVLFELGNNAEAAIKLAFEQQSFMVTRRGAFLDARNAVGRPLVRAALDTLDTSFGGAWHVLIHFLRQNVKEKMEPLLPLAAALARLYDLPWNTMSKNFLPDLEKAEAKGGLTFLEYLTVLVPLQQALGRRKWVDLIQIQIKIVIVEAGSKPEKVLKVEEDTLYGPAAVQVLRGFLAGPLEVKKIADPPKPEAGTAAAP